ncbi:MAG: hypothetical protein AAF498_11630 [Pseudomonadota bacterium]
MSYKAYTKDFDWSVLASEIPQPDLLGRLVLWLRLRKYQKKSRSLRADVDRVSAEIAQQIDIGSLPTPEEYATTILVDHSGSLNQFGKAETVYSTVDALSFLFCRLSIRHEILGFTTESWHGGESRKRWISEGEPENPGRLCDLLHITYRTHSDTTAKPPANLSHLLRRDILKENVDGEALEWATSRLMKRSERHKILIHVSDGAPVDDATISANHDSYLVDHLLGVIDKLEMDPKINLIGIGVNFRVDEYFSRSVFVDSMDSAPEVACRFVASTLAQSMSR